MAKIDERFIVDLKGKQFVTYEGLLDLAHQEGLSSMDVELLQIPTKENGDIAIAKATVKAKDKTFVDIGDASPGSTNSMIRPHIIRMASTRAKARALRDLTNVGMTAIEELGDEKESKPTNGLGNYKKANAKPKDKPKTEVKLYCSSCGTAINQNVASYSKQKFGRVLCMNCQKEERK